MPSKKNPSMVVKGDRAFSRRLQQLTKEFGSRYALAKASGIAASTLQGYATGSKPGMAALVTLAQVANADLTWLLTGVGEIRPQGFRSGALLQDVLLVFEFELGTSLENPT